MDDDDAYQRRIETIRSQDYHIIRDECSHEEREWIDPLFTADASSIYTDGKYRFEIEWLRPWQIIDYPCFYTNGGADRFDLVQGLLGDCWVLAAAASLADNEHLLSRVIPDHRFFCSDSGFDRDTGYGGVFRFRFYYFGEWLEVCVDDRLPTFNRRLLMVHSVDDNEFWGALLEKAYAKLHSSYEALKGGICADALADFTGGIVESYSLKHYTPVDFGHVLNAAIERDALICSGIWGDGYSNQLLPNGLMTGHAYTVSAADRLHMVNGKYVDLIRIRNPWGDHIEWKGRWADDSVEWQYVPADVRTTLEHQRRNDGEFWMDVRDFVDTFDDCDICFMTPQSFEETDNIGWHLSILYGEWNRDSAGGRFRFSDSFANNPQFAIALTDCNDDQIATVYIELSQMNNLLNKLSIGFVVYPIMPDDPFPLTYEHFRMRPRAGSVEFYMNLRTITARLSMAPGQYVIVPTTWLPGEYGRFMLRIWSEVQLDDAVIQNVEDQPNMNVSFVSADSTEASIENAMRRGSYGEKIGGSADAHDQKTIENEIDESANEQLPAVVTTDTNTSVDQNNSSDRKKLPLILDPFVTEEASKFFKNANERTLLLDAYQLQSCINSICISSTEYYIDVECCKALISTYDTLNMHRFHWRQFPSLHRRMTFWSRVFGDFDHDHDCFLLPSECFAALKAIGYQDMVLLLFNSVNGGPTEARKSFQFYFANSDGVISFSSFIHAILKFERLKANVKSAKASKTNSRVKVKTSEVCYILQS